MVFGVNSLFLGDLNLNVLVIPADIMKLAQFFVVKELKYRYYLDYSDVKLLTIEAKNVSFSKEKEKMISIYSFFYQILVFFKLTKILKCIFLVF